MIYVNLVCLLINAGLVFLLDARVALLPLWLSGAALALQILTLPTPEVKDEG